MSLKFSSTGNPIVDYLKISPEAILQLEKLLQKRSEPCDGIRVGVRTRGCSGLSYTIEYALKEKNISKYDDVVICEKSGKEIQIFIDPKVSMFLIGSEMIFKQDELSSGFDFVNPNEKGRCGCGESFNI
ncbi:MAG: HesB/IscA family protein [Alphaproteobacteria bacterium]